MYRWKGAAIDDTERVDDHESADAAWFYRRRHGRRREREGYAAIWKDVVVTDRRPAAATNRGQAPTAAEDRALVTEDTITEPPE